MPTSIRVADTSAAREAFSTAFLERSLDVFRPQFPPAELVPVAAAGIWDVGRQGRLLLPQPGLHQPEGPQYFVTVGPGLVKFSRRDQARYQRRLMKDYVNHGKLVDLAVAYQWACVERSAVAALVSAGMVSGPAPEVGIDPLGAFPGRQRITEWSAKSVSNMVQTLLSLDFSPLYRDGRQPAMVTQTLPCGDNDCDRCVSGDRQAECTGWVQYAPNGKAFKALMRRFGKRYFRAWGEQLSGVWKLEFQDRGAPHVHWLMSPPQGTTSCDKCRPTHPARRGSLRCHRSGRCGRSWLDWSANAWADVLGLAAGQLRDDVVWFHSRPETGANFAEGLRNSDPRRVAVYFTKHGLLRGKDYQNQVPSPWQEEGQGPGRFWGRPGLQKALSSAELAAADFFRATRTARRLERSQNRPLPMLVERRDGSWSPMTWEERKAARRDALGHGAPELMAGGIRQRDVWRWSSREDPETGERFLRKRNVKRRLRRLRGAYGFLAVNDGPAFAAMLERAVMSVSAV